MNLSVQAKDTSIYLITSINDVIKIICVIIKSRVPNTVNVDIDL